MAASLAADCADILTRLRAEMPASERRDMGHAGASTPPLRARDAAYACALDCGGSPEIGLSGVRRAAVGAHRRASSGQPSDIGEPEGARSDKPEPFVAICQPRMARVREYAAPANAGGRQAGARR